MERITKKAFCKRIADETGLKLSEATLFFDTYHSLLKDWIVDGEEVVVQGFGRYGSRLFKRNKFVNPQTGDIIINDNKRVPTFSFSDKLRTRVKENQSQLAS